MCDALWIAARGVTVLGSLIERFASVMAHAYGNTEVGSFKWLQQSFYQDEGGCGGQIDGQIFCLPEGGPSLWGSNTSSSCHSTLQYIFLFKMAFWQLQWYETSNICSSWLWVHPTLEQSEMKSLSQKDSAPLQLGFKQTLEWSQWQHCYGWWWWWIKFVTLQLCDNVTEWLPPTKASLPFCESAKGKHTCTSQLQNKLEIKRFLDEVWLAKNLRHGRWNILCYLWKGSNCQGETLLWDALGWALGSTLCAGDRPALCGLWVFSVSSPSSFTGIDLWEED